MQPTIRTVIEIEFGPGVSIHYACRETINACNTARASDVEYRLVFNDHVLKIEINDTAESLTQKYFGRCKP